MGFSDEIVVSVASGAVGTALGSGLTYVRSSARHRFTYRFWRFLERPSIIVIGELRSSVLLNTLNDALAVSVASSTDRTSYVDLMMNHLQTQEASGLIGLGDVKAVMTLVREISSLRLAKPPAIMHPSEVPTNSSRNLVLIGGEDVNPLTGRFATRLGCRLRPAISHNGVNAVHDQEVGTEYLFASTVDHRNGETTQVDYGLLARGRNPDNPETEILIMAGAHGWGTLAACEVSVRKENQRRLRNDMNTYRGRFEGLVKSELTKTGSEALAHRRSIAFTRPLQNSE